MPPEQASQNNAPDSALQTEVAEKIDSLRQNQDIDTKARGVIRTVTELKTSIDKGSMQIVLKDPVGNVGDAGLNDGERTQFRTELLQILKDIDPARLGQEMQKFNDRLQVLSTKVGDRIKGSAGEKIQQHFEQEKGFGKMDIANKIGDYRAKRESILQSNGDTNKKAELLSALYKETRTGLEGDIAKVDAYLEGRDTTPETKADALERKYAFTDMIAGLTEQTTDGFAVGQAILLDGQNLEGKNIGDVKANVADAYEISDGPGGGTRVSFDQRAAEAIRQVAGKVTILAVDPIKGVQLSGNITRENGVTRTDKNPTWYRPEQIHEMNQNGWLAVGDKDGKPVAFEAQKLIEQGKSLELSAQVEREKGNLLRMATGNIFEGMSATDAGKKIAALLPQYSGIELDFDKDGKMHMDFATFDQLNPQKQLNVIAEFKRAIMVAQNEHAIEREPDLNKQQFLAAEKELLAGRADVAIPLYADFIKTLDSTKVTEGTMPDSYKMEFAEMRRVASEYVEAAKLVSLNELLQVSKSMPEEALKAIHEFQATAIKDKSIDKALAEVKNPHIAELIKLAHEAGAQGQAGKNENYEKMADIFMKMKAYDAAKFYYERAIASDASGVRNQLNAENGGEKIALKESNEQVLKVLNQQIDQWLKSNNVTLAFDQLQNLRSEMFKQFVEQKGVPDEKVYGRMVQMSDKGLLKSSAWDKYREHFDPGNEISNISAKTREFVIKKLPIIAAEIGILIVAPQIGAALAAEYVAAMEGAGLAGAAIAQLTAGTVETISTFVAYEGMQRGALPVVADILGQHETANELRDISAKNLAMDFALMKGATYLDHLFLTKVLKRGAHHGAEAVAHGAEAAHGIKNVILHDAGQIAVAVEEKALMGLGQRALNAFKVGAESMVSHDAIPHGMRHFVLEQNLHPVAHNVAHASAPHGEAVAAADAAITKAAAHPG